ncbi:tyrosinase central domain protein [Aspergillus japonicus CBS 114.51]|uniref:Tyrosinase central domain protein n=1 Tax=Aspergillus japonicus CBS 114.51 TaxID=1448312 RepID=A0A8T8X548_ASPJA|nr:tyrosinase central domain protein [Aspergillus japonicus CBS 114.51]RAH83161.1 tyrosinase central domain protein [Aspergillus japonicus CBS 114.51]
MSAKASVSMLFSILSLCLLGTAAPASRSMCTEDNMMVRKEWSNLTLAERVAYTDAVTCLQNLPSKLDSTEYPGAKNRYADFIATHINYTFVMHLDALFLPWHRGYVWLYEAALREECGYEGAQPYWNWPAYAGPDGTLANSTIFDGSEYSLGSNGRANDSCVYKGPFANYTSPYPSFPQSIITDNIQNNGSGTIPSWSFDYEPSCFQRGLSDEALRVNNNYSCIDTLLAQPTIGDFQNYLSTPEGDSHYGPHGGGHVAMGGNGADLFTSPTDPVFFLHHAQVDHMWWTWQTMDLDTRRYALNGTMTLENVPPSRELTLEDLLTWGPLSQDRTTRSLMDIQAEPFCYRYE